MRRLATTRYRIGVSFTGLSLSGSMLIAVLSCVALSSPAIAADAALPFEQIEDGPMLPDFAFQELRSDGSKRDWGFVELRGRPIVAVLWATWCGICTGEMPKLVQLQAELGDEVLVAALSIDEKGIGHAARTLARRKLEGLRVFHDSQRMIFTSLGAYGVPTAVIANADGRIVARASGRVPWNAPEVRAYLKALARGPAERAPAAPTTSTRTRLPGDEHRGAAQRATAQLR